MVIRKKAIWSSLCFMLIFSLILSGCEMPTPQTNVMADQNQVKIDQATKVMERTKVPTFNESLDRINISKRLTVSNDSNTLQWVYPMSAGRVIGRFPVKGKITSGGKRLTSSQMLVSCDSGEWTAECIMEAPDEMGTYGSSGDYVFWFDPADRIHQHRGDYFISPVPYKIDVGYGTISTEIDVTEQSKANLYNQQIKESNSKESPQPTQTPTIANKGVK